MNSKETHTGPLLLSFFIPGLGQAAKGHWLKALTYLIFFPIVAIHTLVDLYQVDTMSLLWKIPFLIFVYLVQLRDAYTSPLVKEPKPKENVKTKANPLVNKDSEANEKESSEKHQFPSKNLINALAGYGSILFIFALIFFFASKYA